MAGWTNSWPQPSPPASAAPAARPAQTPSKSTAPTYAGPGHAGPIYAGIGGWTFAPWRGRFYPTALPQAQELSYAASKLSAIEINGTFYRTQTAASFAKWASAVPKGFMFAVKAPRVATHRTELAEAEPSIQRFLNSGLAELGSHLGPILWQFPPTRRYDPAAFEAFLALLPREQSGLRLRHAIEARHESFASADWMAQLRRHRVAAAIVDSDRHALRGDLTADFVYARLQRNAQPEPEGYAAPALDTWAARAQRWSQGEPVTDLPLAGDAATPIPRPCFIFFISGDKPRAPDAALAFLRRCTSRLATIDAT